MLASMSKRIVLRQSKLSKEPCWESLLEDCRRNCQFFSNFKRVAINHVSHKAHNAADYLAKLGLEGDFILAKGMPLPSDLLNLICLDLYIFFLIFRSINE